MFIFFSKIFDDSTQRTNGFPEARGKRKAESPLVKA
jgi:hypothetical protein